MSTLLFPIIGNIADRIGKRLNLILLSTIIVIFAYLLMNFIYPTYSLFLLGIGYSIYAAIIWPLISFLVPEK